MLAPSKEKPKSKRDLIKQGSIFQQWKVIGLVESDQRVLCLCLLCGNNTQRVIYTRLLNGKSKSCGCDKISKKDKIVVGDTYGFWKVILNEGRYVECLCTGCNMTKKKIDYIKLLGGKHKSCGCMSRELAKQTWKQRWNNETYSGSEHYRNNLEIYNSRAQKTSLSRWGVANYSQSEEYKQKQVSISKLIKDTRLKNQTIFTLSDGTPVADVCKQKKIPYDQAMKVFQCFGEQTFLEYCNNYKDNLYSTEVALIEILKDEFPNIEKYNKEPIEFKISRRPDFRLENNNKVLYLNIDGLYDHSTSGRRKLSKQYHLDLSKQFRLAGQVIFQFRQDELINYPTIIKSIILNFLGIHKEKINARSCTIREISSTEASRFYRATHLMQERPSKINIGLFYKDELVSCMSFKKKEEGLDITRFSSKLFTSVRGGFSKILFYVIKKYDPKFIQSFCDLRYSTGISYERLNFQLEKITLGWKWTDHRKTFNRLQCRANMDSRGLTEVEYAKELKWYKIYDAGQAKYILNRRD